MSLDDFREFEAKGLRTAANTYAHGFITIAYRVKVQVAEPTPLASSQRESRRRYWFFGQHFDADGTPKIVCEKDVPYLHAFKDGRNAQLKLEDFMLANRRLVRDFVEAPWTVGCAEVHPTFWKQVLPSVIAADLMPPPTSFNHQRVSAIFAPCIVLQRWPSCSGAVRLKRCDLITSRVLGRRSCRLPNLRHCRCSSVQRRASASR